MRAIAYFQTTAESPMGHFRRRTILERLFQDYCSTHRHISHGVFADSTCDPHVPEFRRMLQLIRSSRQAYLVVIPSVEHLGDSLRLQVARVLELDALGCQVRCDDPQVPDPLRAALQRDTARGDGRDHRHAVRDGMRAKASEGLALGKPPYGYRIGPGSRLQPVPAEAVVVRHIFHLYLSEGMGVRLIARSLNESGLTTRRGKPWTMVTVRDTLRNSAHIGTYRRFGYRVLGNHQGIISAVDFHRVQDRMHSLSPRRGHTRASPFLLTGLLYCGQCGSPMMGITRRRTWHRTDGERVHGEYRYYQCQSRVNRGQCQYHTHQASALDDQVLLQLEVAEGRAPLPEGSIPSENLALPPSPRGEVGQRNEVTRSLLSLQRRYASWIRRAARGLITLRHLRIVFQRLDQDRQVLEQRLAAVSSGPGQWRQWTESQLHRLRADWKSLDIVQRQQLLRSLLSRVTLRDGHVHLTRR